MAQAYSLMERTALPTLLTGMALLLQLSSPKEKPSSGPDMFAPKSEPSFTDENEFLLALESFFVLSLLIGVKSKSSKMLEKSKRNACD